MRPFFVLLLFCGMAAAQSSKPLADEPWDLGLWAGGGFSVPGGTKDTQVISVGGRIGKVLTGEHLGGFMRGQFEWSGDLMPLYYVVQPAKSAYGAAFNPVNLKWNFTSSDRVIPYLELGGGVLFTSTEVPVGTSSTNFLTHAAFGLHFFQKQNRAITLTTRYEHISNAGLSSPNPGVNTVQFTIGVNWFK
ncbi:MAG: acyloxyacyl hydrolase [Acidobacteriia bacterium]|nr:acyloxyacyl hydrolase [Terriglobia bacterium]